MISPTDIKYAQRLRGIRLTRNLKQSDVSDLLGFKNQQQYSKLENGQVVFTDEIIQVICEKFELSPEQFTDTAPSNFIDSPYANSQHGNNSNYINDISIINELLKSKAEIIVSKDELIARLKTEIENLKKSNVIS